MDEAHAALTRRPSSLLRRCDEPQEEPSCPVCEERAQELVMRARDRLFGRPGEYGVVRCTSCSTRYLSPRPTLEALGVHYPDDYFVYLTPDRMPALMRPLMAWLGRRRWLAYIRRFERALGRFSPGTQIVDVGCGQNHFLATLRDVRGCQGIGVDFKPEMAAYVRDTLGMPVVEGTLHTAGFGAAQFDVVTMSEYLEHEPDPKGVLREARRILKPGGHVAIEIPFVEGVPAKLFGARWSQIDAPRHLNYFTRETLSLLLQRTGFRLVHTRTFQVPFNLGMSVLQAFGATHIGRLGLLESGLAVLSSLPFLLVYPLMDEFMFAVARAE